MGKTNHTETTSTLSGEILQIMGILNTARKSLGNTDEPPEAEDLEPVLAMVNEKLDALDTRIQNLGFGELRAVA